MNTKFHQYLRVTRYINSLNREEFINLIQEISPCTPKLKIRADKRYFNNYSQIIDRKKKKIKELLIFSRKPSFSIYINKGVARLRISRDVNKDLVKKLKEIFNRYTLIRKNYFWLGIRIFDLFYLGFIILIYSNLINFPDGILPLINVILILIGIPLNAFLFYISAVNFNKGEKQ